MRWEGGDSREGNRSHQLQISLAAPWLIGSPGPLASVPAHPCLRCCVNTLIPAALFT